jgi:hypothetical protein
MFSQDEMFGPQNQVEADKEEDRRRQHVFHLREPPEKRAAQDHRWPRGDKSGLVHDTYPGADISPQRSASGLRSGENRLRYNRLSSTGL